MYRLRFSPQPALLLALALALGMFACAPAAAAPVPGPTTANNAAQGGARTGGGAQQGAGQQGTGQLRTLSGTILKYDGQTLTLATDAGDTTITLAQQTRFTKTVPVPLADLKAGDAISVRGSADRNGNVFAETVQLAPESRQGPQAEGQGTPSGRSGGGGAGTADGSGIAAADGPRPRTGGQPTAGGGQATPRFTGNAQGGQGGGGGGGGVRSARGALAGQIKEIKDSAVILTTANGPELFLINGSTAIRRTAAGTREDIRPGLTARVNLLPGSDDKNVAALVAIGEE